MKVETERVVLRVAGRAEMEKAIAGETDCEVRKAYGEMLDGCLRDPAGWAWHAMWLIERKDGERVGDLCFKGLGEDGHAEIGYGILEEHRGRGYATEAVRAASEWALRQPGCAAVEAETGAGNEASRRVLEKCGFTATGQAGAEGPRFILKKDETETAVRDSIACCGLDCGKCEARIATANDDDALRAEVAKKWSELNHVEISPEMINCDGCRVAGRKTVYCESLCPIRQCALAKGVDTCGGCGEVASCDKVGMILGNNPEARRNLGLGDGAGR